MKERRLRKWVKELIPYVVILVVVVFVRTFIVTPIIVDGASMEPTLHDGEMMLLSKISEVNREDIVIIRNEEGYIIKRVYGLPGETIRCEDGVLYINDKVYDDKFSSVTKDFDEIKIGEHEYFVLGDNREISKDSRSIGTINEDEILGTTSFVIYPFNKFGSVKE